MTDPKPGETWRATYEGVVVQRDKLPSAGLEHFGLLAEGERAPEEFWPTSTGWVYEKLASTPEEAMRHALEVAARRIDVLERRQAAVWEALESNENCGGMPDECVDATGCYVSNALRKVKKALVDDHVPD